MASSSSYPTVRMRLRGSAAAVEKLLAHLEAAELPWCQVLAAGESVEQRGETILHLTVQTRVTEVPAYGSSEVRRDLSVERGYAPADRPPHDARREDS